MAIDYLQQLLWSPNIEARSLKGNFMCVAFMPNFPSAKKHSIILIYQKHIQILDFNRSYHKHTVSGFQFPYFITFKCLVKTEKEKNDLIGVTQ